MRANSLLPSLAIAAPAGTPAIELPRYSEAHSVNFMRRQAWERDQAYDDDLLPAHELALIERRGNER